MQSKSIDVMILVCAIFIGLLVRFYQLDLLGPWNDEIASIFYADNVRTIYFEETHPPLFYLYLKPFVSLFGQDLVKLRFVVGLTGLMINIVTIVISRRVFNSKGVLLLSVILLLNHIDFIHGRMIRQYGIFFDLTILLFILSEIQNLSKIWILIVGIVLSWIHPLGFIPALTLGVYEILLNKKITKRCWVYLISITPIFLYYLSKIIFLGRNKFNAGYLHLENRGGDLVLKVVRMLAGEHYPKMNTFPLSFVALGIVIVFLVLVIGRIFYTYLRKKKEESLFSKSLLLIFITFGLIEVVSYFFLNIQVARYYIFILGPVILCYVQMFQNNKMTILGTFGVMLWLITELNPFLFYEGEREAYKEYLVLRQGNPEVGLVMCANRLQYFYYVESEQTHCQEQLKEMRNHKKNFFFIDMNGYGLKHLLDASQDHNVAHLKRRGIVTSAIVLRK